MGDEKIKISWDDVQKVPEQVAAAPPASGPRDSWGHVSTIASQSNIAEPAKPTSLMYRSWFYLGVAGLLAGLLAWGIGEQLQGGSSTRAELLAQIPSVTRNLSETIPNWSDLSEEQQTNYLKSAFQAILRRDTAVWMAVIASIIGAGLGAVEGVVNRSLAQSVRGLGLGLVGGAIGGGVSGYLAQWLYASMGGGAEATSQQVAARAIGWALAGCLACLPLGLAFSSIKRSMLAAVGGLLGGLIGGLLFDLIANASQSAGLSRFVGIVGIGALSGVFISLAEEVAKAAWIRIEAGRLVGKQFIIYRNPTRLGAAAASEIYLFKDPAISPLHAQIERRGRRFCLVDQSSSTGTRVNGSVIREHMLRDGDLIQVGESRLRYGERSQG